MVQYCTILLHHAANGENGAQEVLPAILQALPRYQPIALVRTRVFALPQLDWRQWRPERLKGATMKCSADWLDQVRGDLPL